MNARTPAEPLKDVHQEIRGVRRDLAEAGDEQLIRAVALVDAMPARGEADALVAPFRQRLKVLRPRRPVALARLIFRPVDPLIVAPMAWRRGAQTLPRHVLAPLAALVRAGLGPRAAAIDAALKQQGGMKPQEADRLAGLLGLQVWPEAARIFAHAAVPSGWREATNLPEEDFVPIARLVAALLGMACDRQKLTDQIVRNGAANRAQFASAVAASMDAPDEVAVIATGLLLIGLPRPDLVLQAMDAHAYMAGAGSSAVAERAIDLALERTQDAIRGSADLQASMNSLRSGMELIKALEARTPANVQRRPLIQKVRESVELGCRGNFTTLVNAQVLAPLKAMGGEASDVQVAALERTARSLRELETIGRQVGRPAVYRGMLDEALASVLETPALTLPDRVRLTELLADTGAGLAVMMAGGKAAAPR